VNDNTGLSGTGRFVRINGTARTTQWGYSIWELEVYGTSAGARMATQALTFEDAEDDGNEISFYPNPADDLIYLEGVEDGTTISIFTLTGSQSLQRNVDRVREFTLPGLTSLTFLF
jgi:hypothetical protein